MASPAFHTISENAVGEQEAYNPSPLICPPRTHDTSRIGWHMNDLECLAKNIETAVSSSFPNHGGSRYRSVNVSMIRWAQDDLGVARELDSLASIFEDQYGFNVETWQIPANEKSHNNLMQKALDFLEGHDSEENLFIIYYAGHGYINQDRQSTWACSPGASSPTVDWSHIQGLFERAKSDVLVLLDCCAAASSAPRRTDALMETIAACGFEGRAPPPGEHSFTTSLIEVLEDWINAPSFSVTMLHSEVLRVLMRRRKERCRNGQKLEWRSTPVHINNFTHPRTIGIELCKRPLVDTEKLHLNQSLQPITNLLSTSTHGTSATYLDLMSLNCDALEESLRAGDKAREPGLQFSSNSTSKDNIAIEATLELKLPHMLISIALDEDQSLPSAEACRRWICAFPGLAKHVKVEGIFSSYSTLLILSIPVVIWNMLPDNPACQPITYVTSRNLVREPSEQNSDFKLQLPTPPTISSFTHTLGHSREFSSPERQQSCDSNLDLMEEGLSSQGFTEGSSYESPPPSSYLLPRFRGSRQTTTSFNKSFEEPKTSTIPVFGSFTNWFSKILARCKKFVAQTRPYADFKNHLVEEYPQGWPQLAAFQHSNDNFAVYRRFGQAHSRLLIQYEINITQLEKELSNLDGSDIVAPTESSNLGLRTTEKDGSDHVQKRDLLEKLGKELMAYYTLLLQHHKLRDLECAPKREHQTLYNWIINQTALDKNQYQWIFRADDFVSLSSVTSLEYHCKEFLKKLHRVIRPRSNKMEDSYSTPGLAVTAKMIAVLLATAVLITPVILIHFWVPGTQFSHLIIFSALFVFCTFMSLFTRAKAQEVLVGTAVYCLVLVTFLGNMQVNMHGKVGSSIV